MAKTKTSKSTNATLGFEQQIWEAACELWGHIPAAEYRKIFTGLIFLKYISTAFEKKYAELVEEGEGFEDEPDAYLAENIFFVPEEARWSQIAKSAHTPEIGTILDKAMIAIESDNKITIKFKTKGDNNQIADPDQVEEGQVYGKVLFSVGGIGKFVSYIQNVRGFINIAIFAVIVFILVSLRDKQKNTRKLKRKKIIQYMWFLTSHTLKLFMTE